METLQRTANRGSISTGYDVSNSLKFEDATNERLRRDNPNSGQRRTYTVAMWLKRTELGYNRIWGVGISGNDIQAPYFKDTDELIWYDYGAGGYRFNYHTNRKFRDTSAWYHLVFAVDTEQSTEADRVKLYVNGVEETSFSTQTEPSQNADTNWNYQGTWDVGTAIGEDPHFSGYMSEVYFIDDQQLDCTNFGEFDDDTGIWKPKAFSGTFGSNDVYANFDDASSLGADSSGNSNDWTLVNITSADQATDTPTNNFCIWSPLWAFYRNSTITEGGTEVAGAAGGWSHAGASMGVMNGRWYWEWKITNSDIGFISFSTLEGNLNLNQLGHDNSVIMGYAAGNLYTWLNGVQGSNESTGWGTWAVNDIIGIYLDLENSDRRFTLYKNGSAISGSTSFPVSFPNAMQAVNGAGEIFPYNVQYENDGGEWNFGGFTTMSNSTSYSDANGYGSFVYSPVLGGVNYYALCTKNLAEYG